MFPKRPSQIWSKGKVSWPSLAVADSCCSSCQCRCCPCFILFHPLQNLRCQWLWRWHCVVLDFVCFCSPCWAQASWLPKWDMGRPAISNMNDIHIITHTVFGNRHPGNRKTKIETWISSACVRTCRIDSCDDVWIFNQTNKMRHDRSLNHDAFGSTEVC